MKENINALDEINKGSVMGMDAIHYIIDKVLDNKFKTVLERQYKSYEKISDKIKKIYSKYDNNDEPHETNAMTKLMTKSGIEMKTLTDKSDSKTCNRACCGKLLIRADLGLHMAKTSQPSSKHFSIKACPMAPVGPVMIIFFIELPTYLINLILLNSSLSKNGAISSKDGEVILPSGSTLEDDFGAKF